MERCPDTDDSAGDDGKFVEETVLLLYVRLSSTLILLHDVHEQQGWRTRILPAEAIATPSCY